MQRYVMEYNAARDLEATNDARSLEARGCIAPAGHVEPDAGYNFRNARRS